MNVTTKYIKDETGTNISPVTSTSSIYTDDGTNLNNYLYEKNILWEGESTNASITFSSMSAYGIPENYDEIEILFKELNDVTKTVRVPYVGSRKVDCAIEFSDTNTGYLSLGTLGIESNRIVSLIQHRLLLNLKNTGWVYDNKACITILRVCGIKKLIPTQQPS